MDIYLLIYLKWTERESDFMATSPLGVINRNNCIAYCCSIQNRKTNCVI